MVVKQFPTTQDVKSRLVSQGKELNRKIKHLGLQHMLLVQVDLDNHRVPFAVKRPSDNATVWGGVNRDITEAFIYGVYVVYNEYV